MAWPRPVRPGVQQSRKQFFELTTCKFLDDARDAVLMGPPDTGKTHLAKAIGYAAIRAEHRFKTGRRADRESTVCRRVCHVPRQRGHGG